MTDESCAALIAAARTATIEECQRALRASAASLLAFYTDRGITPSEVAMHVADGYRASADLLEILKPPQLPGTERAS